MLLQKTSWRIKQFISHRRNQSLDDSGERLQERRFEVKKNSANFSKRVSWLSQSLSLETAALGRTSSSATTQCCPPAGTTARSSASSLCSCTCVANPVSNQHSLSKVQIEPTSPGILYLPPRSSSRTSCDAKTWRLIFSESMSPSLASTSSKVAPPTSRSSISENGSTFNLLEALAIGPQEVDKTPTQSVRIAEDSDIDGITDNIEQLIRETDNAFQAVGSALADAKAATQGWYDTTVATPVTRTISVSRGILKKQRRSPVSPVKSPRSLSLQKGKRKRSGKIRTNLLDRVPRQVPPPPANTPTRWTLTDVTTNMVDVFSGKIFRTEVDEILKPSMMQQVNHDIKPENKRNASVTSTRNVEEHPLIPTEPYHLNRTTTLASIPQRTESYLPSPMLLPSAIPGSKHRNPNQKTRPGKVNFAETSCNDAGMVFKDLSFPSPPRRSNSRSDSNSVPCLPTIPEISPLAFAPPWSFGGARHHTNVIKPAADYIFLPSTSFTLTSPLFRHGPIRLQRSHRTRKNLHAKKERLDWTAFQVTISRDHVAEQTDNWACEAGEVDLDDIMEWWAGFGLRLDVMGGFEKDQSTRKRIQLEDKRNSAKEKKDSRRILREAIEEEPDLHVDACGPVKMEEEAAVRSLPPSPMLDLVVPSLSNGEDLVPMGFNLGHDLGDFLSWESRYV